MEFVNYFYIFLSYFHSTAFVFRKMYILLPKALRNAIIAMVAENVERNLRWLLLHLIYIKRTLVPFTQLRNPLSSGSIRSLEKNCQKKRKSLLRWLDKLISLLAAHHVKVIQTSPDVFLTLSTGDGETI